MVHVDDRPKGRCSTDKAARKSPRPVFPSSVFFILVMDSILSILGALGIVVRSPAHPFDVNPERGKLCHAKSEPKRIQNVARTVRVL